MQMGFNNDVEYKGLTLHIQTEDHGLRSKKVTSQVFFSGAVLESRTISYENEIESYPEPEARDERIRTFMKALHRKFYQRIHEGTYDEQLPLEAAPEPAASPAAVAETEQAASLETPAEILQGEGFRVVPEGVDDKTRSEKSRQQPLDVEEFEPETLADRLPNMAALANDPSGEFVALGELAAKVSQNEIPTMPPAPASAATSPAVVAPAPEAVAEAAERRAATLGLPNDFGDLGPLLLEALRSA